jgi:hypothetical protein
MGRIQQYLDPTFEQADLEYYYSPERHALYRKYYSHEFGQKILDNRINLLDRWPQTLPINGRKWPFLKVVYLMAFKQWPQGPVYYPLPPCDPALIAVGVRPAP